MRRLNTLAEDWEAFSLCIYLNVIEASSVATLVYSMHIWMLNLFLLFLLVVVVALTRNTTSPFLWISISFFAIAYNFKCNGKFLKWLSSCSKVFKANRIFKLCSYFFFILIWLKMNARFTDRTINTKLFCLNSKIRSEKFLLQLKWCSNFT